MTLIDAHCLRCDTIIIEFIRFVALFMNNGTLILLCSLIVYTTEILNSREMQECDSPPDLIRSSDRLPGSCVRWSSALSPLTRFRFPVQITWRALEENSRRSRDDEQMHKCLSCLDRGQLAATAKTELLLLPGPLLLVALLFLLVCCCCCC